MYARFQKIVNFHKSDLDERLVYAHKVSCISLNFINGYDYQSTKKIPQYCRYKQNKDHWILIESFLYWAGLTLDAILLCNYVVWPSHRSRMCLLKCLLSAVV